MLLDFWIFFAIVWLTSMGTHVVDESVAFVVETLFAGVLLNMGFVPFIVM